MMPFHNPTDIEIYRQNVGLERMKVHYLELGPVAPRRPNITIGAVVKVRLFGFYNQSCNIFIILNIWFLK